MVLCSRCKKRPAVVFITSMHGNVKKNEGLCMVCAKQSNIPQISEYMEQMGITDEDLEQMSDQMMDILNGDDFEMGGADILPPYLENMLDGAGMSKFKDMLTPQKKNEGDHSEEKEFFKTGKKFVR